MNDQWRIEGRKPVDIIWTINNDHVTDHWNDMTDHKNAMTDHWNDMTDH